MTSDIRQFVLSLREIAPKTRVMATGEVKDTIKLKYRLDTDSPDLKVDLSISVPSEDYEDYAEVFENIVNSRIKVTVEPL